MVAVFAEFETRDGIRVRHVTKKVNATYKKDAVVQFDSGRDDETDGSIWTDRLMKQNYPKVMDLSAKHFLDGGHDWSRRKPDDIQDFLRDYLGKSKLVLTGVVRYTNHHNGYPAWQLFYISGDN